MFKRYWRQVLLTGGTLLALLFIAREAGIIKLENYQTQLKSNQQWHENKQSMRFFEPGIAWDDASQSKLTVSAKTGGRNARIAAQRLEDELRASQLTGDATLQVEEWSLEGRHWVPLKKTGKLTYTVSYNARIRDASHQVNVQGRVSGTIDCTVAGYCSVLEYRAILARELGTQIAGKLKEDLDDVGKQLTGDPPDPPEWVTIDNLKVYYESFEAAVKVSTVDDQFKTVAAELDKLSKKLVDSQLPDVEKFALTKEGERMRWWLAFLFVERGKFDEAAHLFVEDLIKKENRSYVMWKYWEHYFGERENYAELNRRIGIALMRQFEIGNSDYKKVVAELFGKGEAEAKMSVGDFKKAIDFDKRIAK